MRTACLQFIDQRFLVLGENTRSHLVNAELASDRLGGTLVVACRHNDSQPKAVELADCVCGAFLDRISNGDDTGETAINGDEHGCLALGAEFIGVVVGVVRGNSEVAHHGAVAQCNGTSFHQARYTFARDGIELVGATRVQSSVLCAGDDRLGKRMLRTAFQGGSK